MAQKFTYVGEVPMRELWGVKFPRGVAVTVDDDALIAKCTALPDFEQGEAKVEPIPGQVIDAGPLVEENEALKAYIAELEAKLAAYEAADEAALEIPHPGAPKDEPPADYVPEPEQEDDDVVIPTLGEGVLPANWREEHWKTRQKWCKELLGLDVADGAEANEALEKALAG